MIMHRQAIVVLIAAASAVAVCAPLHAQQVQAQAGPAAAVITTPALQQAVLAPLQPRLIQPYTTVRRRGTPVLVYDSGHEFAMNDPQEQIDESRRYSGGGNMQAEPDPVALIDRGYEDMPYSDFVHVLDYLTPVKSQGPRGLCHSFAATAQLETLIKRRLMRQGVPEQLAEVDLSEEWLAYFSMKQNSENGGDPELNNDGGGCGTDLRAVEDRAFPLELFWPYNPECWPEIPGHPAAIDWTDGEKCAWEYWAHRDPGQLPPASIGPFREHVSPGGPMVSIMEAGFRHLGDIDEALDFARDEIDEGRPVILTLVWPELTLCNPQRSMYCVVDDYPFDLQEKLANGEELTRREQTEWDSYYGGGHEVLLVGYGRPGSDCEGIWLLKNSHGLDSGNLGIVPITDGLIRLSFPNLYTAHLSENARADVDRFAATMLDRLGH